MRRKVIVIGAAGRDFHNFNTRYRDDETTEIVAFTAAQIPGIEGRRYPGELAGSLYPDGIPIYAEDDLPHCPETTITHVYPVDDFETAFAMVVSGQCGKVVLDWSE